MSRTKYGSKGRPEYRDYFFTKPYYDKKSGKNLKPHRHNYTYNEYGQPIGESVIEVSE